MDSVATFFLFFLTYVFTALYFHWRGFNTGFDAGSNVKGPCKGCSCRTPGRTGPEK